MELSFTSFSKKEKKVIRHITDNLEVLSDNSDKDWIKIGESNFPNVVFEVVILMISF